MLKHALADSQPPLHGNGLSLSWAIAAPGKARDAIANAMRMVFIGLLPAMRTGRSGALRSPCRPLGVRAE
jgi:hypothetical protein